MHWHSPFWVISFIGGLAAAYVAAYLWRRRAVTGAFSLSALAASAALWALFSAGELLSPGLATKELFHQLSWLSIATTPPLFFLFCLQYTGRRRWLRRRLIIAYAVLPVVTMLLAWTNGWHHLMWSGARLEHMGPLPLLAVDRGLWHWVSVGYGYSVGVIGYLMIVGAAISSRGNARSQAMMMLAAGMVPWIPNMFSNLGYGLLGSLDLTPVCIVISAVVCAWGLFHFGLGELAPAARTALFDGLGDPVIALDLRHRVVELNPAARALLGGGLQDPVGLPLGRALPDWEALGLREGDAPRMRLELQLGAQTGRPRTYDVRATPLQGRDGATVGLLLAFRDISNRNRAAAERERLIVELQQAVQEVQTLTGLLPICAACKKIRDDGGYWEQIEVYFNKHADVDFSHSLCPDCVGDYLPKKASDSQA